MGIDIGGFIQKPDWPKLGPSLLIASSLILAVRTAEWLPDDPGTAGRPELDAEMAHAVRLAGSVLNALITHHPGIFPQAKEPWYMPDDHDVPR